MKITGIDVHKVALPYVDGAYAWGAGNAIETATASVVIVRTDAGLIGCGEFTPCGENYMVAHSEGVEAIARLLAPVLLGEDPRQVARIEQLMDHTVQGHGYAKAPFDAACAFKQDTRIVRNGPKIQTVRDNALMVQAVAREANGFGRFLADWPGNDLIGLLATLKRRGSRLGGMTGQRFLQSVGKDAFALSKDVVACLREAGLEIAEQPSSKRDLTAIQAAFNTWHEETGLPYRHLSTVMARSTGDNYAEVPGA